MIWLGMPKLVLLPPPPAPPCTEARRCAAEMSDRSFQSDAALLQSAHETVRSLFLLSSHAFVWRASQTSRSLAQRMALRALRVRGFLDGVYLQMSGFAEPEEDTPRLLAHTLCGALPGQPHSAKVSTEGPP